MTRAAFAFVAPDPPLVDADGRFVLRPWQPCDAEALAQAWADPAIIAGCGVPERGDRAVAERWISGWAERADRGLALDLVISSSSDGTVMGEVGVTPSPASLELGWWVGADHRGQGLASAAASLVAGWARRSYPGTRLVARIPAGALASAGVARACGLHPGPPSGDVLIWSG